MRLFCALITFTLFIHLLPAQTLERSESTVKYEKEQYTAIQVRMNPSAKKVKEAWEDFMDDKYDVNIKGSGFLTNKDVLYAEKARIPKVSDRAMDLYTKIVEKKGETTFAVFGRFGYDILIDPSKTPDAFRALQEITDEFLAQFLPEFYQSQVEEQSKKVENFRKKIEDLEKDISNREKKIKDLEKDIQKITKDLEDQRKQLKEAEIELNTREQNQKFIRKKVK